MSSTTDQPEDPMQRQRSIHPNDIAPAQQLSDEEQLVLRQCQKESTMYRAFPLSAVAGVATYFGINNLGIMKPHPTYGASPKVVAAVALGYIIGKMSYFATCQNKILSEAPHSSLAAAVRRTRGIPPLATPEGSIQESEPPSSSFQEEAQGESHEEEMPPPSIRSYDDRRFLNRKMYEATPGHTAIPPVSRPPPLPSLPPSAGIQKPSTNKYGDEGFE